MEMRVRGLPNAHELTGRELESPVAAAFGVEVESDRWIGQRIDVYEITRRIGVGGMGAVYEAVRNDDQFKKRVAIKLLRAQGISETAVRRFRRERQILANLERPHIAALLDGGVTADGHPSSRWSMSKAKRSPRGAMRACSPSTSASSCSVRCGRPAEADSAAARVTSSRAFTAPVEAGDQGLNSGASRSIGDIAAYSSLTQCKGRAGQGVL